MSTPDPFEVLRQIRALNHDDPKVRGRAIQFLSHMSGDEKVIDLLALQAEQDPDPRVRQYAAQTVAQMRTAPLPGDPFAPDIPAEPAPAAPPPTAKPSARRAPKPAVAAWSCTFCGTDDITAPNCPNCGAEREAAKGSPIKSLENGGITGVPPLAGSIKGPRWQWVDDPPFLLVNNNRNFLIGKTKRLAGSRGHGACMLLLAVLFIGLMLAFVGIALPNWNAMKDLDSSGIEATGIVSARRVIVDDEGSDTYKLTYRYWVPNTEEWYSREVTIKQNTYHRHTEGTEIAIRYLPSDPANSTLAGDSTERESRLMMAILSVVGLVVLAITGLVIMELKNREDKLVSEGRVLRGEVISAESWEDSDDDYNIKIKYRFATPTGKQIIKTVNKCDNSLRKESLPRHGSALAIIYRTDKHFRVL